MLYKCIKFVGVTPHEILQPELTLTCHKNIKLSEIVLDWTGHTNKGLQGSSLWCNFFLHVGVKFLVAPPLLSTWGLSPLNINSPCTIMTWNFCVMPSSPTQLFAIHLISLHILFCFISVHILTNSSCCAILSIFFTFSLPVYYMTCFPHLPLLSLDLDLFALSELSVWLLTSDSLNTLNKLS